MLHILLTGAGVSGGLIIAIGTQNTFLLKCGLKKQYAMTVATVCFIGDIFLISSGILGVGTLLNGNPFWSNLLTLLGALFIIWYGCLAAKSAFEGTSHLELESTELEYSKAKIILMAMGITFLNPHVYIDTIIILGGATASLAMNEKIYFLIGALGASCLWFYGLAYLAKRLIPLFTKASTWRILDTGIAFIMFGIAFNLMTPLVEEYIL